MALSKENIGDLLKFTTPEGTFYGKLQKINSEYATFTSVRDEEDIKFPSLRFYLQELRSATVVEENQTKEGKVTERSGSKGKLSKAVVVKKELPSHLRPSVYTDSDRQKELLYLAVEEERTSHVLPPKFLAEANNAELLEILHSWSPPSSDPSFVLINGNNRDQLPRVMSYLESQPELAISGNGGIVGKFISVLCLATRNLIVILDLLELWPIHSTNFIDSRLLHLLTTPQCRRIAYDSRWLANVISAQYRFQLGPIIDLQVLDHAINQLSQEFSRQFVLSLPRMLTRYVGVKVPFPLLMRANCQAEDEALWKDRPFCITMLNQILINIRHILPIYEEMVNRILRPSVLATKHRIEKTRPDSIDLLENPLSSDNLTRGINFWKSVGTAEITTKKPFSTTVNNQGAKGFKTGSSNRLRSEPEGGSDNDDITRVLSRPDSAGSSGSRGRSNLQSRVNNSPTLGKSNQIGSGHPSPRFFDMDDLVLARTSPVDSLSVSPDIHCQLNVESPSPGTTSEVPDTRTSYPPIVELTPRDIKLEPTQILPGTYNAYDALPMNCVLPENAPGFTDECFSDIPLRTLPRGQRLLCDPPAPISSPGMTSSGFPQSNASRPTLLPSRGRSLASWRTKPSISPVSSSLLKQEQEANLGQFDNAEQGISGDGDNSFQHSLASPSSSSIIPSPTCGEPVSTVSKPFNCNFGRSKRLSMGISEALKMETVNSADVSEETTGIRQQQPALPPFVFGRCRGLFPKN